MRYYVHRYMNMVWLLMLCTCCTVSPYSYHREELGDYQVVKNPTITSDCCESVKEDVINGTFETALVSPEEVFRTTLQCSIYIEAKWGSGFGELGRCSMESEAITKGPFLPILNVQGDLFVFDQVNRRILRFKGTVLSQVISIPLTYGPSESCEYTLYGWSNVTTYIDKLFFFFLSYRTGQQPFQQQLAMLSVEEKKEKVVSLEAYTPLRAVNSPIADHYGGVYVLLPPAAVIHFDADFRPEFIYMGEDDALGYTGLGIGWDGNTYTYRVESDYLFNWGPGNTLLEHGVEPLNYQANVIAAADIMTPTAARLLGADTQGQLYFIVNEYITDRRLVRISASGKKYVVASVDKEWLLPFYTFTLAPNGSLYGIVYDPADDTIDPKIIKCVFDEG